MIILRQKEYSEFSDTVLNWAKRFTPRIPIGNTKLYLLWPGTIIGALVGVFKGLVNKFKHTDNKTGKPSNEHDIEHTSGELLKERKFSDIPETTFEDYCKVIPGYKNLAYLNTINLETLKDYDYDWKRFIWMYFPSFLVVASPNEITEYRNDYLSDENPQDYSEVLFMYGNELVFIWDFDRKAWYVQDKTYKPMKEWRIGDGRNAKEDLKKALINFCDPSKDELLKHRIEATSSNQDTVQSFYDYCDKLRNLIEKAFDY